MSVDGRTSPGPPWPVGTRLLAPDRLRCQGHVYEVMSDVVYGTSQQVAKCLVCEDLTQPLDLSRWELAGVGEMMACIETVEAEVARLQGVLANLKGERKWVNFG